jgi:CRP/FNR family transcriptional regulator, cyclic AMP receptor protein
MESAVHKSCLPFTESPPRLFCDLPGGTSRDFDALKSVSLRSQGATLFREGQPARGIFVLCDGRAKLSVCSESGKRMILRIAGPGEILGLSAALAGTPHEVTAELLDNAQVAAVRRKDLLRFLHEHREACLQVVNLLSQDLHVAYDRVRSLGLGRSRRSRAPRIQ